MVMSPKYILLIRHGESEGNRDKTVNQHTPNHLVSLTEKGHRQAQEAGKLLREFLETSSVSNEDSVNPKSVVFYTSPYRRARQTLKGLVDQIKDAPGVEYTVYEDARMREQDFGNFQSSTELMEAIWRDRAQYGHFFYRIPHGESAADVYDRVGGFNETLFRQFQKKNFPNVVVLVTHGIWARVFLMKWFRWTYEKFETLRNIPHSVFIVMKKNERNKFLLKTPLPTWDDLQEDELDTEVAKEVSAEVSFNTRRTDQNDLDIKCIIDAQKTRIRKARAKDNALYESYRRSLNQPNAESGSMTDEELEQLFPKH